MVLVGRVWPDFHGRLGLPGENLETLCSSGEDQASGEDQPTLREYRLFQKKGSSSLGFIDEYDMVRLLIRTLRSSEERVH